MGIDIGIVANVNAYFSGVISVCANTYLLLAVSRAKSKIGLYKWMMVIATTFDIVFSTLTAFSCPTIAAISQKSSVLFVKGGFMLPYAVGRVVLVAWIVLLCLSLIVSPCLFVFRYIQVCRKQWLSAYGRRVFFVFAIPISLAMSAAAMLIFASYPNADDITEFKDIAFQINLNAYRAFLVACLDPQRDEEAARAAVLVAACANLMLILVCSLLAMIICSRLMVSAVKEAVSSQRAMRLQQQLQKTLVFQFVIPFVFIHIPFCLCCIAPFLQLETGVLADILPFLFAWSPALNPIVVLYFARDLHFHLRSLFCLSRILPLLGDKTSSQFRVGNVSKANTSCMTYVKF
ncbi:hypothetical protein Aduo_010897 [Ancylostoma duodenale]